MDKVVEQLLQEMIKFLTAPNIGTTDKFFVVVFSFFVAPYVMFTLRKISKQFPELLPKFHSEKVEKLKKNLTFNVIRNKLINSALEKMVFEAGADKAYILQFHNGGENVKGIPFIKFTITNEWCPVSVKREAQNFKDVPLGVISGLSYWVIKEKNLYFPNIERLAEKDSGSYGIFKDKGVQSVYVSGLFDLQDSVVGLVILECYDRTELDEDELFAFEKTVGIISGLVLCKDGEDPNKCCAL